MSIVTKLKLLDEGLDCHLTRREVLLVSALSLSTLYRLEREGRFPRSRRLNSRNVVYLGSEVYAWMHSREVILTPEPIASPGPGKRRGRPKKNATSPTVAKGDAPIEPPEVARFEELMVKAGLTPLEKIVADGIWHEIEFKDMDSCIVTGCYILDLDYPLVGIYRCDTRNVVKRWPGKKLLTMSDQEKSDYDEKVRRLRKNRKLKIV